jgi:hypothetical protein
MSSSPPCYRPRFSRALGMPRAEPSRRRERESNSRDPKVYALAGRCLCRQADLSNVVRPGVDPGMPVGDGFTDRLERRFHARRGRPVPSAGGGPTGTRTPNPLGASEALYQLELQARGGGRIRTERPPAYEAGGLPSCPTPLRTDGTASVAVIAPGFPQQAERPAWFSRGVQCGTRSPESALYAPVECRDLDRGRCLGRLPRSRMAPERFSVKPGRRRTLSSLAVAVQVGHRERGSAPCWPCPHRASASRLRRPRLR